MDAKGKILVFPLLNVPSNKIYVLFPLNIPPLTPSNLYNPT